MTDARSLTLTLGGKWHGSYGTAPCPVCQSRREKGQNALTLADGRNGLLANCKRSDCSFRDILGAANVVPGTYTAPDPTIIAKRDAEQRAAAARKALHAERLWLNARAIDGTFAETYLRGRGITCALPATLRFVPSCWHASTRRFPALVAAVQGTGRAAVHRTYLQADGSGKADADPNKAMMGATAGGAVRLTDGLGYLVVCEGIETGLSLASGLLSEPAAIWAALSTSGIRGLRLPVQPGRLTIAPDGDDPGRAAAHALAERAHALGWQVSLFAAPDGCDWNDIVNLKGEAA
jgi:hypothetical protein